MKLVVQKYGGTSVASVERIEHVAKYIADTVKHHDTQLIVVVSAMGEYTDDLLKLALSLSANPKKRELDMLLSAGERISMALLSIKLHDLGVAALSLTGSQSGILTDCTHGNARIKSILGDRIRTGLLHHKVVIVAGFQGVNPESREITTLGRGGSDLSAIAIASTMKADACEIYKDVDGVYTVNPKIFPKGARVLRSLSWQAMQNLSWYGASVLHSRAALLSSKFEIPLNIRSSFNFEDPGTFVQGNANMESPKVDAITYKSDVALLRFSTKLPGHILGKSANWLWEQGEVCLLNQFATQGEKQYSVTQIVPENLKSGYMEFLQKQDKDLKWDEKISDLSCVSIVGEGFWQSPEKIQEILQTLSGTHIYAFDSKNSVLSICVKNNSLQGTVQALHQTLLKN